MTNREQLYKEELNSYYLNRNLWSGVLFGMGLIAFFDEAVFHQLLHWHHFYDRSTPGIGLVADGLFHAFSWFATVWSLFILAELRSKKVFWSKRWWAGVLVGVGAFQLYDGVIQHKIMRIHQIRYGVDILPYDLAWNISAGIILAIGLYLTARTKKGWEEMRGIAANEG